MYPAITLRSDDPAPLPPPAGPPEPDALAHLRRAHAAQVRRLEETLLSLDNLLAPQDWLDAGDGFPTPGGWRVNRPAQRTQDRSHAPLAYLNEDEWRQHVALARDLCARNHLALGFRDHVANFVGPVAVSFVPRRAGEPAAGSGLGLPTFSHAPPPARTAPAALLQACQQLWDEWCAFAEWGQGEEDREEECRRRLIVEGETTLRFFVGDSDSDGLPHVRHVEPELIRTPPGSSTLDRHGWGVVTAPNDDEHEEGLWLCDPDDTSRGREVPVTEYVRVKANVDRTVKRGLSDFLPVGDHLRKVLGLLDNMAHVARVQAAIAWWEQYPSATLEQVATQVRLGADYQRPKVHPGSPGAATEVTGYEPGTVVRTEGGREVKPGPVSSGTAGFDAVQRMVLRGVGFRWGCPSYFSGDGDASFASVLVTGSPFVRLTQARQERVKAFACRVAARVLEFAERSGRLPAGTARLVRPVGTRRPVVIADEEKKARTFLALYQQNCADPMEFIRATGADPHQVAANIRAWKARFEDPPPGATGPNGPTPGGGPTPTPPGSAGGDGSSPNAPLGEWLWTQEGRETDGHGNPVPTTALADGLKWELRPYKRKGRLTKAWRRVKADGSDADDDGTHPPGHFNAEEVGKQLVDEGLVPDEKELNDIRANGIPKGGKHEDKIEKRWEQVIARVLGPGWVVSKSPNAAADVTGSLEIDGKPCRVVLDGKFSVAVGAAYDQLSDAVQNKLKDSAKHGENTIVAYVVAYHVPTNAKEKAEDGVYLRIGAMPQVINVSDSVVNRAREFGPFRILDKDQYAALREGKPEAVHALRDNLIERLADVDLKRYKEKEQADDLVQSDKTVEQANEMGEACEKHGVAPETVGKTLAGVAKGLSAETQVAHTGAVVAQMTGDKDPNVRAAAPAAAAAALGNLTSADLVAVSLTALKHLPEEVLSTLPPVIADWVRASRRPPDPV